MTGRQRGEAPWKCTPPPGLVQVLLAGCTRRGWVWLKRAGGSLASSKRSSLASMLNAQCSMLNAQCQGSTAVAPADDTDNPVSGSPSTIVGRYISAFSLTGVGVGHIQRSELTYANSLEGLIIPDMRLLADPVPRHCSGAQLPVPSKWGFCFPYTQGPLTGMKTTGSDCSAPTILENRRDDSVRQ